MQPIWEQRWHPWRREWVIIAAHRSHRPWLGEKTRLQKNNNVPAYEPTCYFCPRNKRVSGQINPDYKEPYVFVNDHPPVGPQAPEVEEQVGKFYRRRRASGIAKVICYTPLHNTSLAEMPVPTIVPVVKCWQEQYREIGNLPEVNHVLIFENRGKVVGVSNPHPHCQVYGTNFVFSIIQREVEAALDYRQQHKKCIFCTVLEAEKLDGRRLVYENETHIAFIPFFAQYAYEVVIMPRNHVQSISQLSESEVKDFADILHTVLCKYDNLFQIDFPYVMAFHQAPTDGNPHDEYHFHVEIHPPLRQPNLLKYLAGPEIGGGNIINPTTPEEKAQELREADTVHYKNKIKD